MKRQYLEDYQQKEQRAYGKLINRIWRGKFNFKKDRYPPDERFIKLQRPVALTSFHGARDNLWAQIPFCGSLILILLPLSKSVFERVFFKTSDIPKVIDFIKETGRLQIAIGGQALAYEGLDFLEPFFEELKPPAYSGAPDCVFGSPMEIAVASETFNALADLRFFDYLKKESQRYAPRTFDIALENSRKTYVHLKLGHYAIVEELENLLVDDPSAACFFIHVCRNFITDPRRDLRSDLRNFALEDVKKAQGLPLVYQPEKMRFPCEIGNFLLERLTFAPKGLEACKELMYHYDSYDLMKTLESLNDAILADHHDIVNKETAEYSEILDRIWNDPIIPRRVKGLEVGIPLSVAAVGSVAAGPVGAAAGFLGGLGFTVANKLIDVEGRGLAEKLARLHAKNYQVNIYDFKKKYKLTSNESLNRHQEVKHK